MAKPSKDTPKDPDTRSSVTVSGRGLIKLGAMAKAGGFTLYAMRWLDNAKYRVTIGKNY